MASNAITLEYRDKVAIITLNQPKKLNALNSDHYYQLATFLNEIAARDGIYITVLAGTGRFFSAGADVSISSARPPPDATAADPDPPRRLWLQSFVSNNLFVTHAFYSHPKILVVALNGPAIGLSAALVAFADFVYAAPHAYLLTPFTSLGLVAEGGASRALVQRLGVGKASEALIQSKRITCEEMVRAGFVNEVVEAGGGGRDGKGMDSARFLEEVLRIVEDRMGGHLNADSMVKVKALIRAPERDVLDQQNVREVLGGLDRFTAGIPQEEFRKLAMGEKRHKL